MWVYIHIASFESSFDALEWVWALLDKGLFCILESLWNKIFGCVHADNESIVSLTLNYVEKLTEIDTAPPESPLLPPPSLSSKGLFSSVTLFE